MRIAGLAALIVSLFQATASGRPGAEDARALYRRADRHFNVAEIEQALPLYEQAYRLKPIARYLFTIGECQRYLGRSRDAIGSYQRYLELLPRARNRAVAEQRIQMLTRALASGGASRPAASIPLEAPPVEPESAPPPPPAERSRIRPAILFAGVGLTAALLATGIATGQLAHDRAAEYRDLATSQARRLSLKEAGERLRTTSIVTFALAGAAAIATAVHGLLWYRHERARRAAVAVVPWGGGLVIAGEL
jgi:tetratricopeptide (TPR) repeat protein